MTPQKAKTILLCGSDAASNAMFHGLLERFPDLVAIQESAPSRRAMLRGRLKRLGWVAVSDQILFLAYASALGRRLFGKRIQDAWRESGLNTSPVPADRRICVPSINDPSVPALIRSLSPRAVSVHGTRIIKKAVLDAVEAPFINYHAGITPRYRGVHGAYWARAEGQTAECGVTVHLVDEGVDTGAIIAQSRFLPGRRDNFFTLPIRQLVLGVPLMAQALQDALSERLKSASAEGESHQRYHPGLTGYVWRGLTRRAW